MVLVPGLDKAGTFMHHQQENSMENTATHDAALRMQHLLKNRGRHDIPRGEVWIGSAFLQRAGFDDTLDNHFKMADLLGHGMVCLPLLERPERNVSMGYRYFELKELHLGLRERTGLLAAIIDSPFQRMVNQRGLMQLLMDWSEDRQTVTAAYTKEEKIVLKLIDGCPAKGIEAIILADDLAGERGPFINPLELDAVCSPFYCQAISRIREAGCLAFLHCCGNLTQLVPLVKSWNFDGLAAIQLCKNDPDLLNEELGGVLITGIDGALLEADCPSLTEMESLKGFAAHFGKEGRLILSSSCGLYSADFWGRLQGIYQELDGILS